MSFGKRQKKDMNQLQQLSNVPSTIATAATSHRILDSSQTKLQQLSMPSWQPSQFVIEQGAPGDIRRSERNKKPPAQSKSLPILPFI